MVTAPRNFAVGPLLWGQLPAATSRNELERSAWDRGVVLAATHYESQRSLLLLIQIIVASGAGLALGSAVGDWSLLLQFVVGGGSGLFVFWTVPTLWAIGVAVRAPVAQRNFARSALRVAEDCHQRQESALRLQLGFRDLGGISERIARYRALEAEPDERMRMRMQSECDPRTPLIEWATTSQNALLNAGLHEEAREFAVDWGQLTDADEIEGAYRRLRTVAERVVASAS